MKTHGTQAGSIAETGNGSGPASLKQFKWSETALGDSRTWHPLLRSSTTLLFGTAVPMIVLWGREARLVYNDAFRPLAADRHPAILGQPIAEGWPDLTLFYRKIMDGIFQGRNLSFQHQPHVLEQGGKREEIFLSLDFSPLRDDDGSILGALGIIRDTTDEARVQQRLRIAQAIGEIGTFEWYPESGEMAVSEEFRSIWGLDADEPVTDTKLLHLLHPEDRALMVEKLRKYESENPLDYIEYRRIDPHTGEVHWIARRGEEVTGPNSDTRRYIGVAYDITARKTAEQAILESEAKFRLLAQSMPNHVWTARATGKIDWLNERAYDFAGVPKGTLDGQNWVNMVHPDDLERIVESWAAAVRHGHLYKGEVRLRRRDGVYRWHIVRAVPVRNRRGDIKRWIGTNTDIDDQKSAESALADLAATLEQRVEARTAELLKTQDALRQSQKMEAIGNLTGGIAHDFNNLLQVISGNLHLIAKDIAGNPKLEQRLQNAIKGVTRGAKLASQLLAFGRRQPLAPKIIHVGRLINNMDDILHRALGEAVTVETIIDDNLWSTEIDPGNVENAVLNLAINARDAMEDSGQVLIEVRNVIIDAYSVSRDTDLTAGHYVMIAVRDSGCGMSREVMEKVFEPFFTTKPEGKGTGLGLSMVYGFVKQSGGHVIIESQPGEGTTIRMYLPRALGGEDQDSQQDNAPAPIRGGSETILVAEDDEAVRDTVVATLTDLGYRVLRAKDGPGALTVLESGARIDLLFSDMIMPGSLKGDDLVRKAREYQPGIAVLFTSGYPDGSGAKMPEEPGIELLAKPYSREALAQKVRATLDARQGVEASAPQDLGHGFGRSDPQSLGEDQQDRPATGPILLLCEDDYLIRLTTSEILESQGYTVLEAGSGQEALALLRQYPVEILMTDFGLPDMTGVELANHARTLRPTLPLLFATGHVDLENLPTGPTRQVTKPFSDDLLSEALSQLLAASRKESGAHP